jgi:ubiquinone biosynthesis protein Coq4
MSSMSQNAINEINNRVRVNNYTINMFKSDQDDDFVNKIENFYSNIDSDDNNFALIGKIKDILETTNASAGTNMRWIGRWCGRDFQEA